jgi:hypothetical protein
MAESADSGKVGSRSHLVLCALIGVMDAQCADRARQRFWSQPGVGRKSRASPQFAARGRVVGQASQVRDRLGHIRFCPYRIRDVIGAAWIARRYEAVTDKGGTVGVHEIDVAGPGRRDHGLAQQHCFRRHQAEALASVQRQHDIGGRDQRVVIGGRQVPGFQPDVGAGGRSCQPGELRGPWTRRG